MKKNWWQFPEKLKSSLALVLYKRGGIEDTAVFEDFADPCRELG